MHGVVILQEYLHADERLSTLQNSMQVIFYFAAVMELVRRFRLGYVFGMTENLVSLGHQVRLGEA